MVKPRWGIHSRTKYDVVITADGVNWCPQDVLKQLNAYQIQLAKEKARVEELEEKALLLIEELTQSDVGELIFTDVNSEAHNNYFDALETLKEALNRGFSDG